MKTVVCGMSGGVDSSVAALLLKEQGYNVIGLFMNNWKENDGCCTSEEDFSDVRRVCSNIGIPYYSVDFSKDYMERVFSYFLEEYRKGRTPNPDVLCNREIKFGPFKDYARSLGADFIATGHYCGISHEGGVHRLLKAADANKDQTYFLNQLSQEQLSDVLFPLSGMLKPSVRAVADKYRLATAVKKDSTGICFIGERKFREFLMNYLPSQPGEILTVEGKPVGKHCGLMYYTIGQRKGLDIGGKKDDEGRWFVIRKDLDNNILYVAHACEEALYSRGLVMNACNWIPYPPVAADFDCFAKFRYRQQEQPVTVHIREKDIFVEFKDKQRAITEGQYCVFYDDIQCLGGGVIEKAVF